MGMNSEENRDRHIFKIITRWIANSFKNIFKVIKEINYKRFLAFTTVTLTNHLDSLRKTPHTCRLHVTSASVR